MNRDQSVYDAVSAYWHVNLEPEVLKVPADSVVGKSVVKLCNDADELLNVDEDAGMEDDVQFDITRAVVTQCNVWLFG